jgi:transcriptional regulator with XRE-family HTH domain
MADPLSKATVHLRPLRLRAMMTQEELALKSGVGTRTVRDIESGKVRPQPRTLRLLIEALDLDEADRAILAGVPDEPAARDLAPMTLPSGTIAFTGRGASLARLDEAADAASSPLVVLSGTGGVGKTMLALHWGHRAADRFPAGASTSICTASPRARSRWSRPRRSATCSARWAWGHSGCRPRPTPSWPSTAPSSAARAAC